MRTDPTPRLALLATTLAGCIAATPGGPAESEPEGPPWDECMATLTHGLNGDACTFGDGGGCVDTGPVVGPMSSCASGVLIRSTVQRDHRLDEDPTGNDWAGGSSHVARDGGGCVVVTDQHSGETIHCVGEALLPPPDAATPTVELVGPEDCTVLTTIGFVPGASCVGTEICLEAHAPVRPSSSTAYFIWCVDGRLRYSVEGLWLTRI